MCRRQFAEASTQPLLRLVGDRDPNFQPVLPVVPAQNVWDKYSSLPDIREVRIPPQNTSLHTRPAWNVTYMLCLVALALHLADAVPAQRAEQIAVEGQAALDRRDDQIDVMNAG